MNLLSVVLGLSLLFPSSHSEGSRGQQEAQKYLRNVVEKFAGIKDYVADVKVHLDIETVKAPDMEAKVYYKEPNKVKIDAKGLFFLPKEVGVFNPRKFNPDEFEMSLLDTLTYDDSPAVRISLTPRKAVAEGHNVILTIDEKEWLIREIATVPYPGRRASARIFYGIFDGFQLPTQIEVNLDVENVGQQGEDFHDGRRSANRVKGKVEVYYSNYKINSGLSDDIFKNGENR